jgi:hypothetical protein
MGRGPERRRLGFRPAAALGATRDFHKFMTLDLYNFHFFLYEVEQHKGI